MFLKYNTSYKTYRNKSKNRRDELRKEFFLDTDWSFERYCKKYGKASDDISRESDVIQQAWSEEYQIWLTQQFEKYRSGNRAQEELDYDSGMQTLADCGVPFTPDGTPIGIGGKY